MLGQLRDERKERENELRISCIDVSVTFKFTHSNRQQDFFVSEFSV